MQHNAAGTIEGIGQQDHSLTSEYRIFGPPGCGKTTSLTRQIRRAVDKYGADAVLVTSFSRGAAAELAGRDLPIAPDRIGTLHSHCWHALGGPEIAEANVDEWNRDNPHMAITPVKKKKGKLDGEESGEEDDSGLAKDGDSMLQQLSRFRGMQMPEAGWSLMLRDFASKWTEYKQANGLTDFTDLIETCYRDVYTAPRSPSVIFADEAQDLNRMQLALIRKWGERAEYFIVAGDDDQTIYTFTGAEPQAVLSPDIPDDHKIILKQSYRIPRAVHALAEKTIRQVKVRQEKVYLPRPEDGRVAKLGVGDLNSTESLIGAAEGHIAKGQTVMFLASCSYMLKPLVQVLRNHGIPFHNPYRRTNGFWNPLRLGKPGSTPSRLLALLVGHSSAGDMHRPWTQGDVALWAEWLASSDVLRRGAKKALQSADLGRDADLAYLDRLFQPSALDSLMDAWEGDRAGLLKWWRRGLTADALKRAEFPIEIASKHGAGALMESPKVVVGTIHSVKGGEADVVYLFPDLSRAGCLEYLRPGAPYESVVRLFYVGMTRARHTLYICPPEKPNAFAI